MMLRCRRCRKGILESESLLAFKDTDESPATVCSIWHVNIDALPEWILTSVHQAQWTVGKLNCHNCSARLGGFNFIHHFECPCGRDAAIHLNKSRVDPEHKKCFLLVQPKMMKPRKELNNLLTFESQSKDPERNQTKLQKLHLTYATAISHGSPAVTSTSQSGVADTPSTWPMSAETEESPHVSRPILRQHDNDNVACEASVGSCSFISVRRHSPTHQQLQLTLEDMPCVETSFVHDVVHGPFLPHRSSSVFDILAEEEEQVTTEAVMGSLASHKLSKREKNHLKGLRRKQRKKERWLCSQMAKAKECLQSSEEEEEDEEGLTCAVCFDIYICPYICQPCGHCFCEPCLRTIANGRPRNTPCPLCRTLISHTNFNKELDQTVQTFFPKLYRTRKQKFESSSCAKWPLPSSRKSFCTFWRQQRRAARTLGHWPFHQHGGYSLAALDQFNMCNELFDICLVILYIFSANWILVFLFLSVLVYYFCF